MQALLGDSDLDWGGSRGAEPALATFGPAGHPYEA
jgi:hypothetical protein